MYLLSKSTPMFAAYQHAMTTALRAECAGATMTSVYEVVVADPPRERTRCHDRRRALLSGRTPSGSTASLVPLIQLSDFRRFIDGRRLVSSSSRRRRRHSRSREKARRAREDAGVDVDDDDDDDDDDDGRRVVDRLRSDATRGVARAALVRLERERDERRGRRWRWSNAPFRGGRGGEEARDARGGDDASAAPGACQHELPDRSLLGSTASSNSTQSSEGERPAL